MGAWEMLLCKLGARSAEDISGMIVITFETDPEGHVRRQTKVTTLNIKGLDGQLETRNITQIRARCLRPGPTRETAIKYARSTTVHGVRCASRLTTEG
jgi:hypothetical protein